MKEKTVILVTHQLHFLKHVDKIIVLDKGEMVEFGTYDELMSNTCGRLYTLLDQSDSSNLETSSGSNTTISARSESISKINQNAVLGDNSVYWDNDR